MRRSGWTVCIASTHSHLTTQTRAKASNLKKFHDKHPDGSPTQFLIEEKGYRAAVADGAEVRPDEADPNLVVFYHAPCPKFRIAFLLAEPWRASDFENQEAANVAWADWVRAVAASLGLAIDESCLDPSRLFFLPRLPAGWRTRLARLPRRAVRSAHIAARCTSDHVDCSEHQRQAGLTFAPQMGLPVRKTVQSCGCFTIADAECFRRLRRR